MLRVEILILWLWKQISLFLFKGNISNLVWFQLQNGLYRLLTSKRLVDLVSKYNLVTSGLLKKHTCIYFHHLFFFSVDYFLDDFPLTMKVKSGSLHLMDCTNRYDTNKKMPFVILRKKNSISFPFLYLLLLII